MQCHRHDGRQSGLLDDVERDQRLLGVGERLRDDEVDTRIDRPRGLFLEHRAHGLPRLVVLREDVRVGQVAREERAALVGHLAGELERTPVELFEQMLLADDPQLLAVPVVRERLDDIGAGVNELAMELGDDLGVVEDDLGNERARLQVTPPFAFEQIALGADHGALLEALEEPLFSGGRHSRPSLSRPVSVHLT